jgi:glucose-6-phosphate isomerase
MVTTALRPYGKRGMRVHCVSNIDSTDLVEASTALNRETALFVVALKTFASQESTSITGVDKVWLDLVLLATSTRA